MDAEFQEPAPPSAESLYDSWVADPSPDNLGAVVASLEPTINYKLNAMGVRDNPQMRHQARLYAADAVKSFDPASGAALRTWTQNQLQSLQRYRRESQGPVKVPDRAAIDAWAIERANRELTDELEREPTIKELADRSFLSPKRIAAVRKITRPVAAADQMYSTGDQRPDFLGEALDYIYDDSDPVDRRIIEMTTGYGGTDMLQKNEIAARLGISASQVTRRADRIGRKLQEMETDLEEVYS